MTPVERRDGLGRQEFLAAYLAPGRPVIVTDAMDGWTRSAWTAERLVQRFGQERVPLYDELFQLVALSTLGQYVATYFGSPRAGRLPYLRWYSTQSVHPRYPWADAVLDALAPAWSSPAFLPDEDLLLPWCPPGERRDPTRDRFPARGLYLSPAGARTRLHFDPWHSDAVLCQLEGRKRLRLLAPDQARFVAGPGRVFADLEAPDPAAFPELSSARVAFEDVLEPGEALYLPRTWLHDAVTLEDSVSLTWNFCHRSCAATLRAFVEASATPQELRDLAFFGLDVARAFG